MKGTAQALTAAARAASPAVRSGAVSCTVMPVLGVEALICYRLDDREVMRRRRAGAGAIPSADLLELLLGLPVGMPVPVSALTSREGAALRLRGVARCPCETVR